MKGYVIHTVLHGINAIASSSLWFVFHHFGCH